MTNVPSRQTKKAESPYRRSVVKSLVLTILTLSLLVVMFVSGQFVRKAYSIHSISGTSMTPALTEKDTVLVKKKKTIIRYDVIAFSVEGEKGTFVKRVIGMPGDKLFVRNDRIVLSVGEKGDFETTYTFQLSPSVSEEIKSLTAVPEDVYFTIGDHVDVSKDSRAFGFVPKQSIEGTVQFQFPSILKN
ncbi:signal peptidase I [Enterococcus raffinosus]|uniref:signal peptidase I n=1 Tax=Enterococcus TaxID=1350 RepID=UPI001C483A23|nr:signal peptidase I [Enterococcus raffinosus]MDT2570909.1 signal peptidase I [Enterococcus raffinosus]QXJ59999.1 signal peptidase I [Enterococcus raffinosus]